jgi:hypothetical protein
MQPLLGGIRLRNLLRPLGVVLVDRNHKLRLARHAAPPPRRAHVLVLVRPDHEDVLGVGGMALRPGEPVQAEALTEERTAARGGGGEPRHLEHAREGVAWGLRGRGRGRRRRGEDAGLPALHAPELEERREEDEPADGHQREGEPARRRVAEVDHVVFRWERVRHRPGRVEVIVVVLGLFGGAE